MKKIILIALIFVSCSGNRNDKMTELINEKKILEDSISTVKLMSLRYENRMTGADKLVSPVDFDKIDTTPRKRVKLDSLTDYMFMDFRLKRKLKDVNFSIDSLSKMK